MKVIVWIEDDIDILSSVMERVEEDYKIIKIHSLREASEKVEVLKDADLIILDLIMIPSEKDSNKRYPGKRFLEKLRKEYLVKTPVVIFSVVPDDNFREKVEGLNVVDILRKPLLPSELKLKIDEAFEQIACSSQSE